MTRIKKRYAIPAAGVICVAATVLVLVWCKRDGVVSVHRGFRAASARVDSVRIDASLVPHKMRREPGVLFKQRLIWSGPYLVRVLLRDDDQAFQQFRMTRCSLQNSDGTWRADLTPLELRSGWKDFNDPKWTDKLTFTGFHSDHHIDLPEDVRTFILDIEFELMSDDTAESFQKTFTLKPSRNSYSSYGIDRMIAF